VKQDSEIIEERGLDTETRIIISAKLPRFKCSVH